MQPAPPQEPSGPPATTIADAAFRVDLTMGSQGLADVPVESRMVGDCPCISTTELRNKARLVGSGIMLCSRPPNSRPDDYYFLLGRDRYHHQVPAWRSRPHHSASPRSMRRARNATSPKWSAPGGGPKSGEDECLTAAREFFEETAGSLSSIVDVEGLAQSLRNGEYFVKVVSYQCRRAGTRPGVNGVHPVNHKRTKYVMFVKVVPWCPGITEQFDRVYTPLSRLDNHLRTHRKAFGRRTTAATVASDPAPDCATPANSPNGEDQVRERLEWMRVLQVYYETTRQIGDHPAICPTWDPGAPAISDIHVRQEYLEKSEMRWWGLSRLREVLHGGDSAFNGEVFCDLFLVTLRFALSRFRRTR